VAPNAPRRKRARSRLESRPYRPVERPGLTVIFPRCTPFTGVFPVFLLNPVTAFLRCYCETLSLRLQTPRLAAGIFPRVRSRGRVRRAAALLSSIVAALRHRSDPRAHAVSITRFKVRNSWGPSTEGCTHAGVDHAVLFCREARERALRCRGDPCCGRIRLVVAARRALSCDGLSDGGNRAHSAHRRLQRLGADRNLHHRRGCGARDVLAKT